MSTNKKHNLTNFSLEEIKSNGFKKPEDFFDSFEDSVFAKISEENLPKETGFKIADDYFDTLENKVLDKLPTATKVVNLRSYVRKFVPMAAAASIVLFIGLNYFNNFQKQITFDDLTVADIESWYEDNEGSLSESELAEVITFDEAEDVLLSYNDISETDIDAYINTIDTNTLINEID